MSIFNVAQTAEENCRVWNQPSISTLAIAELPQPQYRELRGRQFVFPNVKFNCSGNIRKINFIASRWSDSTNTISPQIQLWNSTDRVNYRILRGFDIDTTLLDVINARKYYSYTVDPPLPFESGHVLGIFSPERNESTLQIIFWGTGSRVNYRSPKTRSPMAMVNFDNLNNNNLPLLSVETGM